VSDPDRTHYPACDLYHDPVPDLGYLRNHSDADRRLRSGEDQWRCPICCKWTWQSFFHHRPLPPIVVGNQVIEGGRREPYRYVPKAKGKAKGGTKP